MAEKFICTFSKEELEKLFWGEGKTLKEMCAIVGCKSDVTMAKIMRENGINTNRNAAKALQTKKGMTDVEFKDYLLNEYETKSICKIATDLGVTQAAVRKYFKKYEIPFKATEVYKNPKGEKSPSWKGGKHIRNEYIEVYEPNHPRCGSRHYVYEHIIVMEKHIGRYLKEDEVVHHKDGNKLNNDISNLQLLTRAEHTKLHEMHKCRKRGERNEAY